MALMEMRHQQHPGQSTHLCHSSQLKRQVYCLSLNKEATSTKGGVSVEAKFQDVVSREEETVVDHFCTHWF